MNAFCEYPYEIALSKEANKLNLSAFPIVSHCLVQVKVHENELDTNGSAINF